MLRSVAGIVVATLLLSSTAVIAQGGPLSGPFRPYLHVFLAFAAAWLIIGAWVFRIGRKVSHLADQVEARQRGETA